MTKTLVVVESPAKAKTIEKYLGDGYAVRASYGHIRDLPRSKLGVDPDQDFAVQYEVPEDSKRHVADLKKALKQTRTWSSRPTTTARARRSRSTWRPCWAWSPPTPSA